ncbi:MAG: hypothetical protein GY900_12535 [Actinomycetia bacterium]|nr:hypothetical protein [Actinomycetes bacterium]
MDVPYEQLNTGLVEKLEAVWSSVLPDVSSQSNEAANVSYAIFPVPTDRDSQQTAEDNENGEVSVDSSGNESEEI